LKIKIFEMGIEIRPPVKLEGSEKATGGPKEQLEGKVVGRWGAAEIPAGSTSQEKRGKEELAKVLEALKRDIEDERAAMEHYQDLAKTLRRMGPEFFGMASDLEAISLDEANHLSRITYLVSVLERRLK